MIEHLLHDWDPYERTFKYLGITFSENLTWSDHLNNISTKINQRIGLLRRIKTFIPCTQN
jgi:hypothetical protein